MRKFCHHILLPVAVAVVSLLSACGGRSDIPRNELIALDNAIRMSEDYHRKATGRLDSLHAVMVKARAEGSDSTWQLSMRLAEGWRLLNADSSWKYSERAWIIADRENDPARMYMSKVTAVKALSTAGLFSQARKVFEPLEQLPPPSPLARYEFWKAGRILYSNMGAYADGQPELEDSYKKTAALFDDSIMAYLPPSDEFYRFLKGERLVVTGHPGEAQDILEELMKGLSPEMNLYAMTAFQLAKVYEAKGDDAKAAAYLAKAAESDLRCAVKDGLALPSLATLLYNHNHLDEAFHYANFALSDARKGNARMRVAGIASMLPDIDDAYRRQKQSYKSQTQLLTTLLAILLFASIGMLVFLYREIRHSRNARLRLARTSRIQDSYIATFIGLSSTYARRLDTLSAIVGRKISAGQSEELLKLINSGRLIEGDNEDFYNIFDKAILDLYPEFLSDINSLLRPDSRLEQKRPGTLSAELRIYALVRLGIEESTRIAQILGYSPATVYSYRNRMRNRAISRDTFDADVAASSFLHSTP